MKFEVFKQRMEVEEAFEYRKWEREIPYLKFPDNVEVKIIPPFAGAVVRMLVRKPDQEHGVSVYLDCYEQLGFVGQPYWEIYPYNGDTFRCYMNETDKLIEAIMKSLDDF